MKRRSLLALIGMAPVAVVASKVDSIPYAGLARMRTIPPLNEDQLELGTMVMDIERNRPLGYVLPRHLRVEVNESRFTADQVKQIASKLIEHQKNGGSVVFE